jgi:hypothetical protein
MQTVKADGKPNEPLKNSSLNAFDAGMRRILSISKAEMLRREAEYKKASNANPNKRGPKKKDKQ